MAEGTFHEGDYIQADVFNCERSQILPKYFKNFWCYQKLHNKFIDLRKNNTGSARNL